MNHRPLSNRRSKGFTLIEILVAVGIVALLAAISIVGLSSAKKSNQATTTRTTVGILQDSVNSFYTDRNSLPVLTNIASTNLAQLQANANDYVNSLAGTDAGRKIIDTLKVNGAVTYTGLLTDNPRPKVSGPIDVWGQPILMSGDATANAAGTTCWFWSTGPDRVNNSSGGNPVAGDDIGGSVNTRK